MVTDKPMDKITETSKPSTGKLTLLMENVSANLNIYKIFGRLEIIKSKLVVDS